MKTLEITVSPTGESHIETKGFTGGECREASQFLEQALGRVTSKRLTAEFYAVREETQAREQQRE